MASVDFIAKAGQPLFGVVSVPGDKSISHRALMIASIAQGTSVLHGVLTGHDCMATLQAMQMMGVKIEGPHDHRVVVHGVGKHGLQAPLAPIDCGNSGTSMRLLAGLLVGQPFDSVLTGDASLRSRPMERVTKPLHMMGADIKAIDGHAPILIAGGQSLCGIRYVMPVASAQVKSSLLLAGMYASGETEVIEPSMTRDHTERMLTTFSYPLCKSEDRITINALSEAMATEVYIPGDLSSAAFFIVAASLIEGSELFIRQVGINPTRMGLIHILNLMQADIQILNKRLCGEELVADLLVRHASLEGVDIPTPLVPLAIDEFPIIFIAAACAKGRTVLHGAKELRLKESDRIEAMVTGLKTLGIEANAFEDGVVIEGGQLQGGEVSCFGDHRIAMAFAIAGCVARAPVVVKQCENVATSFPDFVSKAQAIHLDIHVLGAD